MSQDHDALFKIGFGNPDAARSQLRALLPADLLADMDLGTLELVGTDLFDDRLPETRSDRLYEVQLRGRKALVFVLHEHQSTPDALMPFRLLGYMVKIWEGWLAKQSQRPKKLPAIIPVVLYHGAKPWDVATEFLELIDLPPEALSATKGCLPEFRFVLDDMNERSDEELRARGAPALATMTLILFKQGRRGLDMLEVWKGMQDLLAELAKSQDWSMGLRAVTRYTCRVGDVPYQDLADVASRAMGPEAGEVVMTTAERLLKEGEERGLVRGRLEGRLEGERRMLLRLLRKRFSLSESVEQRVAQASESELETWSDRVLDAATLDEIFAE